MKNIFLIVVILLAIPVVGWASDTLPTLEERLKIQEGVASFYGKKFHMRKTANGEIYDMKALTAAHKYLPFGTMLKVTNLKNGNEVWVRINDRLPQSSKRIIDLSRGAAEQLDMVRDGIVHVRVEVADEEVVLKLMEHFQDDKPEDLRLRLYENPIELEFDKPEIFTFPLQVDTFSTIASFDKIIGTRVANTIAS
ncbi:septal ring lytic transglycosylase RlpA family protein [Mongoliitalea daihaiensis]|uniref:septal ring lytic transglycosylase RlpA family protein n=1 Tax=Mongoliitalea daihaiensis TaxID=2782006 RepID=UPI001F383F44|nr:septal ring lytic transglycosylase RlpA family protein [Mongoliitalea daihaiensis]UJP65460.1 septal ring lytic transglycosylase RlpA family protein [Mongoliitalea daihaiensis]